MKLIRKHGKPTALFFLLTILTELFYAPSVFAITGHNSMPEYRSFEPVATTNMVNVFDGGFTYNIPLMDVPNGYPITLSYHSNDVNNEAQSSWVGLGWTLNPGAINRLKKGFPDEFNGEQVQYHSRMPKNWTLTAEIGAAIELFSKSDEDKSGPSLLGANLGGSIRYNNYNGIGRALTGGVSGLAGLASLNFTYSQGRFGFDPTINPGAILELAKNKNNDSDKNQTTARQRERDKIMKNEAKKLLKKNEARTKAEIDYLTKVANSVIGGGGPHVKFSRGGLGLGYSGGGIRGTTFSASPGQPVGFPTAVNPYEGFGLRLKVDVGINFLPVPFDLEGSIGGSYVQQVPKASMTVPVYGYMNSDAALSNENSVMDYYTESDKMFEKKDVNLAVPFPNNDIFSVTGEALGGAFRAYKSEFGHYRKNKVKSETFSGALGADVNIASALPPAGVSNLVYTVGGNLGGDYGIQTIGPWKTSLTETALTAHSFKTEADYVGRTGEKFILRYNGDKAGNLNLAVNKDLYKAKLAPNILNADLDLSNLPAGVVQEERALRSSYISMSRNSDFGAISNNKRYKVHEKELRIIDNGEVEDYSNRSGIYGDNGIGEVVTYNSDGVKYTYGLPIYTKNEKELQYSLNTSDFSTSDGQIAQISETANIDGNAKKKLGYESSSPYATQFLLTQITSPDYIDRNFNGPTPDDFGSYTKFNYTRVAGGTGDWYKYRSPYQNAGFDIGSLSDRTDDMGSFSYGEKELYYLTSIISKTHVAIFTLENRQDGRQAQLGDNATYNDLLRGVGGGNPSDISLKKLTKIELFAINDCQKRDGQDGIYEPKDGVKPLKTVHFEYNYSLCGNVPNNTYQQEFRGSTDINSSYGKLTLEKIWFEYEGKLTSKISPYKFKYDYPSIPYTAPYASLSMSAVTNNPGYNVLNSDRWGNYRDYTNLSNNLGYLARFWPYVDQKTNTSFDPAVWCLKQIVLPSGGEIHIQYEQHDYQFVQDKRAMAMVPLDKVTSNSEGSVGKKYFLDLAKIGITETPTMTLAHELFAPMMAGLKNNRLYFNFLYRLLEDDKPSYLNLQSEFIEGYARISGYGIKDGKIFFVFHDDNDNAFSGASESLKIDHGNLNKREIPFRVCKDFYLNNRQGKISGGINALENDNSDNKGKIFGLLDVAEQAVGHTSICKQIDPEMSYVRIQLPANKAKRGGGVRVKRLMMYENDQGITGEQSLYGQEYIYKTRLNPDDPTSPIISSGVATNEPSAGRRENPLINPIDKESQSKFEAILYGRDMYGNEGPLGETLLPSPSVGYSEVTIRNIHLGTTSTGYEVHEYHTCRTNPLKVDFTPITKMFEVPIGASGGVGGIGAGYNRVTPHLTQGYRFIQNEMHGQIKRTRKYSTSSKLEDFTEWKVATYDDTPIAEEFYEYYPEGSKVSVMDENMGISEQEIGVESEMLAELREVSDFTIGGSIGADVSAGALITWPAPFPFPVPIVVLKSVRFNAYYNESVLRTHVTTKIIKYPAILKKVTNVADGVRHVSENLVFDKYTGNPVVVRAYDDFGQNILSQDFMASWSYKNMRAKALNEKNIFNGTFDSPDFLEFNSTGQCGVLDNFTKGDFLEVRKGSNVGLYHVEEVDYGNDRLILVPSGLNAATITSGAVTVFILQSGYTNQMNVKAGNIVINDEVNPLSISSPAEDPVITAFVAQLNGIINGGKIERSSFPAGLKLMTWNEPTCLNGQDIGGDIYVNNTGGTIEVEIGEESYYKYMDFMGYNPSNPHPLVTDLNSWLDKYWKYNIPEINPSAANGYTVDPGYVYRSYIFDNHLSWLKQAMNADLAVQYDGINGLNDVLASNYIEAHESPAAFNTSSISGYQTAQGQPFKLTTLRLRGKNTLTGPETNLFTTVDSNDVVNLIHSRTNSASSEEKFALPQNATALQELLNYNYTDYIGRFGQDNQRYLVYEKVSTSLNPVSNTTQERVFGIRFYQYDSIPVSPLCTSVLINGESPVFKYNPKTGYIVLETAGQCPQSIECLRVCNDPPLMVKENVITASAVTFKGNWDYYADLYPVDGEEIFNLNVFENGSENKWRLYEQYGYRTGITRDKNFNSGKFSYNLFNWKDPDENPAMWVKSSTIDKYSPNGEPIEDHNILNIYSTSKYGYGNTLPVLVAQNAKDHSVAYESFENQYSIYNDIYLEDGILYESNKGVWSSDKSHTGSRSIKLTNGEDFSIALISPNDQTRSEGMVIRGWFHTIGAPGVLTGKLNALYGFTSYPMKLVSSAGEWQLYEAIVPANFWTLQVPVSIKVNQNFTGDVYMDDVRVQPLQSEMVCYVYDKAHRLIAVLDDQNYSMQFEYNMEGALVRKLKETVQGVKTISETQYNTKGESR